MKKALKEILLIVAVLIVLNVTGLFSEVQGAIQRAVMFTGILNADAEKAETIIDADYNLRLRTPEGKQISLDQYKGKTIFLNLWATWCGPCIAEMPSIHKLYQKVGSEDMIFVMISLDEDPEKAVKFINSKEYTFPVYFPASSIPDVYRTGSIPTTHVISPEGKIVFSKKGTANYNTKKFKEFLSRLSPSLEGTTK